MRRFILLLFLSLMDLQVTGCRSSQKSSEVAGGYATKSSRGDISFDLTPRVQRDDQLLVEVRATTHSGDLADLDLASIITLHANQKTYRPTAVTNLRGHHSSGTVTFALEDKPKQFSVILAPIRNMGEQRFEWP